jgi:hypothetical protein
MKKENILPVEVIDYIAKSSAYFADMLSENSVLYTGKSVKQYLLDFSDRLLEKYSEEMEED